MYVYIIVYIYIYKAGSNEEIELLCQSKTIRYRPKLENLMQKLAKDLLTWKQ